MSAAVVASVRDAVVAKLNAASLTPEIAAVAIYDIVFSLQDLKAPGRMVVMPQTKTTDLDARNGTGLCEVTIDVAVQYKYGYPTPSELDPYLALIETIAANQEAGGLFFGTNPLMVGSTPWYCTHDPKFNKGLYLQEHITQFRTFTSVVSFTFLSKQ